MILFRICELHFTPPDFEAEASGFDIKTGKVISVPLKIRRLKAGAFPTIFENYPSSIHSYRQMADSQYLISIRQLLECEKKLRLQSCVKLELTLNSTIVPLMKFDETVDDVLPTNNFKELPQINIDEAKITEVEPYLLVLAYLGGYCSHKVIKKLACSYCRENLVVDSDVNLDERYQLVKNLDRGGLKCPTQFVITTVIYNYVIINCLFTNFQYFMKMHNHREVTIKVTFDTLKKKEFILDNLCHNGDYITKFLLISSTNIMLKNLCAKENDNLIRMKEEKKAIKKRKLQTLQK